MKKILEKKCTWVIVWWRVSPLTTPLVGVASSDPTCWKHTRLLCRPHPWDVVLHHLGDESRGNNECCRIQVNDIVYTCTCSLTGLGINRGSFRGGGGGTHPPWSNLALFKFAVQNNRFAFLFIFWEWFRPPLCELLNEGLIRDCYIIFYTYIHVHVYTVHASISVHVVSAASFPYELRHCFCSEDDFDVFGLYKPPHDNCEYMDVYMYTTVLYIVYYYCTCTVCTLSKIEFTLWSWPFGCTRVCV